MSPGVSSAWLRVAEDQAMGHINRKVEALRSRRGLSIRAMARELGMNYSALSHRLQRRVNWTIADVLAIRHVYQEDVMEGL